MFWDKVANFYDIFANVYNGKVNKQLVFEVTKLIEPYDIVLECEIGRALYVTNLLQRIFPPGC